MSHQPPQDVIAAARAAMAKWNVPASDQIGQWALESAWGTHLPPGSNNPFGIKALKGEPSVLQPTHEFVDGKMISTTCAFRKFDSIAEAFDLHARLLATAPAYAASHCYDHQPDQFAKAIAPHYATDPNYYTILHAVMQGSNLYQYDTPAPGTPA